MSLLDKIKERKTMLTHTETLVRTVDGHLIKEDFVDNHYKSDTLSTAQPGYVVDNKPDLQVAEITANLLMGSQDIAADYGILKTNNITHVISLGIVVNHFDGITYTFIDILDVPEFNIVCVFDEVFKIIDEVVKQNGRVLVHCNAGVSRSASVVIGYVMKNLRLGYESAFEFVRVRRLCVKPNEGFVRQLRQFGKELGLD